MSNEPEAGTPAVVRESGPEALLADLKRYGDALLPGSAEVIARRNPSLANLAPDRRAERIAELVESPLWAPWRNPGHAPATTDAGQPFSPLREALARHGGDLKPGAVDALVEAWSGELAHLKPAQLAGEVVRRLAARDNRQHLASPPPLPQGEARVSGMALHHFRDVLSPAAADRMAAERAREWGHLGERELVVAIGRVLRSPEVAARYGAKPVASEDARLKPNIQLPVERPRPGPEPATPKAPAAPARDAGGKFEKPPARPTKPRSTSF
jgi:hypothetical protein